MKLYAICLVKNEEDVIEQTLTHAIQFCDQIFVIDNGSTDATWSLVQSLARRSGCVTPFRRTSEPYDEGLRWHAYQAHHQTLTDNDWWLILDGDEFLAEDPRPVIIDATAERADVINAWQIQFYFTEKDHAAWVAGADDRDAPIYTKRRFYRIDWQEPRLFRNQTVRDVVFRQSKLLTDATPWGAGIERVKGKVARRRVLNRHFQYRDPEQIAKRLQLRYGRPEFAAQTPSRDWHSVLRNSRDLDRYEDDGHWRFRVAGLSHCYSGWLRYVVASRYQRLRGRIGELIGSPGGEPR